MNEGKNMYKLACDLYPIYRSITGSGVRETFDMIDHYVGTEWSLNRYEVPTGKKVFDWVIPREWKINAAYIEDKTGKRVIDFKENSLHVLGYSTPIDKWVTKEELKNYIFTQPNQPDVIPYVTSYYRERTGFCMSENQWNSLQDGEYHIKIDSELFDGSLTYADLIIPGESDKEIVFSTYSCHPSMANDNCSGLVLSAQLIKYIASLSKRYYTYRFIFIPETIGSITYLSENDRYKYMRKHFKAGFTFSCVGDDREYSIIHSKSCNSLSDRVLQNVFREKPVIVKEYSFLERGSDERQYNSPMIGMDFVGFCRSKYNTFSEYHTSLDDLTFISQEGFQGSFDVFKEVVNALENNFFYKTIIPCEPQLGKRGLYPTVSQKGTYSRTVRSMTDFIAYADGDKDLIEISDAINSPVNELIPIIQKLLEENIIIVEEVK